MATEITLTSQLCHFTFSSDVVLSHAKLIRDTVMGQVFTPKRGGRRIKNSQDIYNFVKHDCDEQLAKIPFTVYFPGRK